MIASTDLAKEREVLKAAYGEFNARKLEEILVRLHPNVEWANGMEGGHVLGREGVRAYWTRQWLALDPHVEPITMAANDAGGLTVEVHQVVRDLQGLVLVDTTVYHSYRFADGFIKRMDIL